MDRRNFLIKSGLAFGAGMLGSSAFAGSNRKDDLSRIGMSTTVFRNRFKSTYKGEITNPLTIEEVPEYFTKRFGVKNIEFWSVHFESLEKPYLEKIRTSLKKHKCTLINIQVDTPAYDISDPDPLIHVPGIKQIMEWIDAGEFLGAKMIRSSRMKKSIDVAISSVRKLTEYAGKKGIVFLVENHGDMFMDFNLHLKMAQEVKMPNFGLLADFGNYPDESYQYEALRKIASNTTLVSAKTKIFDENYNHTSFDFEKCVRIFEDSGYKGIYSLEQYAPKGNFSFDPDTYDFERIADWMIEKVISEL